jgi:DNA-binding GntR family transcriptional regulator
MTIVPTQLTTTREQENAPGQMRLLRGGMPLYRQLANIVRTMARDGMASDMAFTDHDLCKRFGVSRTTVRQALQELAADGLVVRLQGKGTTLLAPKPGEKRSLWVFGALEDMLAYGHETTYVLTEHGPAAPRGDVAESLQVKPATTMYRFVGVRSMDGAPFVLIETWLPYQIGVQILPHLHGNSPITALVEDRLGIHVAEVEQMFSSAPAPLAVAHHIGLRRGRPVLLVRRVYFDTGGVPIGLSINYCNPERFQYRVRLKRRGNS